jgi:hypothetical protein
VILTRGETELARWPFRTGGSADLGAVEQLARLQMAARRLGLSIRLRDPGSGLWELLDLAGLATLVAGESVLELAVEMGREPEGGEEVGVKEGMEPGDPIT